jgi:hypothetical protein
MRVPNLLAALLVIAAACSQEKRSETPPASSSFVGIRHDPLPTGVAYESGSVILGSDGKPSRYVLSHVKTPNGSMLWLDEMLADEGATRRRIVRAAMDDPTLAAGERFVIGTCGVRGGRFDGDIAAIVKSTPGNRQTTVVRAWRANPAGTRFDSIAASGVSCDEPGGSSAFLP